MKKLISFILKLFICAIFVFFVTGIYTQGFSNNFENNNDHIRSGNGTPLDLENIPEDAYYPGLIRVQFNPVMEESLDGTVLKASNANHVITGIYTLDEFNKEFNVYEYEPVLKELYEISPASLNYKERHRKWGFHLWYDFKLDKNEDIIEAVIELEKLEEVEIAEPVFIPKLIEPAESRVLDEIEAVATDPERWIPNDPIFPGQWGLKNTGQSIGGQQGVEGWDVNAEEAWNIEKGDTNVVVAVKDSGVFFEHEDIQGNMWYKIGPDGEETAWGQHGTHVAGIISAITNNSLGVAGLAGGSGDEDGVRIMTIPIINGGYGAAFAFMYAADNDATISQNSWSIGTSMPSYMEQWIDYFNDEGGGDAMDGGITFFSAGNNDSSIPNYPGAYKGTIAVAAHDNQGKKSGFSNYGEWVDITAPGTDIWSLNLFHKYFTTSGTSMSCPFASGAAALVISNAYGALNNKQLKEIILNSANEELYAENPEYDGMLGAGALDVYAALELLDEFTYKVTFDVVDKDGNPINDAMVTFNNIKYDPGDYLIKVHIDNANATFDYKVEKYGYLSVEDEVYVDDDVTVNVTLQDAHVVTFEIEDKDGNEIENAIVTLDEKENEPGDYVFYVSESGTYDYTVAKEGYNTVEDQVTVEEDITIPVTMYDVTYTVTFEISDQDGNDIENAVITFDGNTYEPGEYVLENIGEGDYDYTVEKEGYTTVHGTVTIEDDTTVEITMEMILYTVTFNVIDEDGNAITDAAVTMNGQSQEPGEYIFENIEPGTYDYVVERTGYITVEGEVEIVDEDVNVDVAMNLEKFILTLIANPQEGGALEGEGEYHMDEEVTLTATAHDNYDFINWTGEDGEEISNEISFVYIMPSEDVIITANFELVESVPDIASADIKVFPNPARDKFYVESNEMIKKISVIDISGQVIKHVAVDALNTEINVSNIHAGIYFIQIHSDVSVITKRVQITR